MCGRYAVTADPATLAAELDAIDETEPDEVRVGYNIAPTSTVAAVVDRHERSDDAPEDATGDVRRRIRAMRWGFVPVWAKQIQSGPLLFNARSESVATKPAFRQAYSRHRCLVPMEGWYEWVPQESATRSRPVKIPYFMSRADGQRLFAAGVWSAWRNPDDDHVLLSCAVLTTAAAGALARVHDRMPLMLPPNHWDQWLDPDASAPDVLLTNPGEEFAEQIDVRQVSTLVNSVRNDSPKLIEAVSSSAAAGSDSETLF
ncbi:SOS response-associated peptidase [Hoyosella rhizosphaerae]|uniref:Abasic site processing protein n=1 Tax=Hoyosella rhizosphaerae TaxID=1755582 RepID=A0A916UC70_9ACTN|nr:SOS response-associated peptidase [Hoyosella rhizosphaerae]MBN4925982.1 SOS response-associated peptidase [Hoyosella rhizosphaerae]GGC66462.1 DUF159 family protein [Hoyosella rhizosphaerae]